MNSEEASHQCYRCGDEIHVREDQWFRHSWNEEPPPDKVDMDYEDWFADGGMFCRSCHADFLSFTGVKSSA